MPPSEPTSSARGSTLTILGCRGSIPVSGEQYCRYGGNTTSFAIAEGSLVHGFIDAGTGINAYSDHGLALGPELSLMLTHYHWDHIQGLSMLGEMWGGSCEISVFGPGDPGEMVSGAIRPPWFPAAIADQPNVEFHAVHDASVVGHVAVTAFEVQHPQGGVGYRLDGPRASIAVITDHEARGFDPTGIVGAAEGVDVVVFDAQYLPDEVAAFHGWGHSSWRDAIAFAAEVGAAKVVLTSHAPIRSDDAIDAMVEAAEREFSDVVAARPGLVLDL